jgi:hypothetical protein
MINTFLSLQATKENQELSKKLHEDMNANFLEHTMYDINDSLTSILALCDMEQMKNIPKIKNYIQRVNELLDYVQIYQDKTIFNVNHVLNNVIDIIKDHFKSKVKISYSFNPVKALAKSNQLQLEQILLYVFVELIKLNGEEGDSEISIKLHQREKDAQIIISKNVFSFSSNALKEIDVLRENFVGSMQINPKNEGVEIDIRLPLFFKKPQTPTHSIEITPKKQVYKPVKSFKKV